MIENPRPEEENIIKDIRNFFRLKKELNYTALKDKRNLFRLEKESKEIKTLFKHEEEETFYKPVRASNFWRNNYIEYESNSDRNKTLSVEEYLIKIRPYLKDINNLKKSDPRRLELTIANNFISSIDNDEGRVMHSKSDNIGIMIDDEANEVIKELFVPLKNRYQNNYESMNSEFVFDYITLLYYKCHKINPNRGESYKNSPDWIKNKKAIINPINKKGNKCFQYTITVVLNHEEIEKYPQRITKIKPFINKY